MRDYTSINPTQMSSFMKIGEVNKFTSTHIHSAKNRQKLSFTYIDSLMSSI